MARHQNTRLHRNAPSSQNKYVGRYVSGNSHRYTSVADTASDGFWSAFTTLETHYQMVCLILTVIILSMQLPTFSPKLQVNDKMHELQSALDVMSTEVKNAGKLCTEMAEEVYLLYCNVTEPGFEDEEHEVPKQMNLHYLKKLERAVTMDSKLDSE